jgi:hypothetical protein
MFITADIRIEVRMRPLNDESTPLTLPTRVKRQSARCLCSFALGIIEPAEWSNWHPVPIADGSHGGPDKHAEIIR